ncbi:MAG: M13 family metallopeptidase [Acidobacteriota bacterium]|nr:M13 family metallopeptidase [Acidobacteriota bacterium]
MRILSTFRKTGAVLLLLAMSISAFAQSKAFDTSQMDTSIEACENFYDYANGAWLKNTEIPGDRSRYGTFDIVRERNQNILREILETAAKNTKAVRGSNEQLIGDFYASCMDEAAIEAAGLKPIEPYLKHIEKIKTKTDVQNVITILHKDGLPAVFDFAATIDAKNSSMNIAGLRQGGLSLPNRDYYTSEKFREILGKYDAHVERMFALLGDNAEQAKANVSTVLKIQTRLSEASKSPLELRDVDKNYNRITRADLQKLAPNFDWNTYFKQRGAPAFNEINVGQPKFFEEFNRMLSDVSASDWQIYLRWMTVFNASFFGLPKRFTDENFDFYSRTLRGVKEQQPRWKRCVGDTDLLLGEAVGAEYVKKHFQPAAKKRMNEMIENLFAVYRERIGKLDWMSQETKEKALVKLNAIRRKVGYDENPRGYAGLKIDRHSFWENLTRAGQLDIQRSLADIGTPFDKNRWRMTPQTVNAGYSAVVNDIHFPAAMLQPPFFDFAADDAINYGGIGFTIGHEITHGFDNRGSKYDGDGNLKSWWLPEDRQKFEEKASCVTAQYAAYEVLPGVKMNGELTLPENIADLGGLSIAYDAFKKALTKNPQPKIDGFTPEQRFFLSYARTFAAKITDEAAKLQTQNDPHSLGRFRVNGVLSNMPEFAEAFGCKIGKPMVRENRCRIW